MPNTGYKIFASLREMYTDTGLPTGVTKPNLPADDDYIPPVIDLDSCPIDPKDDNQNLIVLEVFNDTAFPIALTNFVVRATSVGIDSAYRNNALASFFPSLGLTTLPVNQLDSYSSILFDVFAIPIDAVITMKIWYKKASDVGYVLKDTHFLSDGQAFAQHFIDTPTELGTGTNYLRITFE